MADMKQFPLRLPRDLKAWLAEQAAINGSSQNSEVISAIRAAMARSNSGTEAA